MRNATRNGVDERQVPFMDVADLALEHGHVVCRGQVIEINDEWQGVGFVKEEFVVVVFLDHVRDFVVVAVHVGSLPPVVLCLVFPGRVNGHGCRQNRGHHQTKTQHAEDGSLHWNRSVDTQRLEGFQSIGVMVSVRWSNHCVKMPTAGVLNG